MRTAPGSKILDVFPLNKFGDAIDQGGISVKDRKSERGAILVVVISAVAIITVMGLLLLGMISNYQQRINFKAERTRARYLAEAGVYRSIWELHYTRYNPDTIREGGVKCDGAVDATRGANGNITGGEANRIPFYDKRENTDVSKKKNLSPASYGWLAVDYDYREGAIKSTGEYNGTKHSYVVKIEQN